MPGSARVTLSCSTGVNRPFCSSSTTTGTPKSRMVWRVSETYGQLTAFSPLMTMVRALLARGAAKRMPDRYWLLSSRRTSISPPGRPPGRLSVPAGGSMVTGG